LIFKQHVYVLFEQIEILFAEKDVLSDVWIVMSTVYAKVGQHNEVLALLWCHFMHVSIQVCVEAPDQCEELACVDIFEVLAMSVEKIDQDIDISL
jgi:hypothetical protein